MKSFMTSSCYASRATSSNDVNKWHISPNRCYCHVCPHQYLCHVICSQLDLWPNLDQPGTCWPLTFDFDYSSSLTLTFTLTFDIKSKFLKWPILLNFLRRFRFWTMFLHLKLQNYSIGQFIIVVSSRLYSRLLQGIFSSLSNLKFSSSFHIEFKGDVRNILDILANVIGPSSSTLCVRKVSYLYTLI